MFRIYPDIRGACSALCAIGWVAAALLAVVWSQPAWGDTPSEYFRKGWRFSREIQAPTGQEDGLVAVDLSSAVLTNCRSDLADVRIADSAPGETPLKIVFPDRPVQPEPFPARVFRVSQKPGQYTDLWLDKTAKILTSGVLLKTPSEDFVRRVEIRGCDDPQELYVIRVDSVIADLKKPVRARSLRIDHPLNNFQYMRLRIFDDNKPPIKIAGAQCYPPAPEGDALTDFPIRITENRRNPDSDSTIVVGDLGARRFPVTRVSVASPDTEFAARVKVSFATSPLSKAWREAYSGCFYRIKADGAVTERLRADFGPNLDRYIKIELSGRHAPPVVVDEVSVKGVVPKLVFRFQPGHKHWLVYDNPLQDSKAPALTEPPGAKELDPARLAQAHLGAEKKAPPPSVRRPLASRERGESNSFIWHVAGVTVLLSSLLLVFSLMLRSRSRKRRVGRPITLKTNIR